MLAELVDHERVMDIAASHVRTISQVRHACIHNSRAGAVAWEVGGGPRPWEQLGVAGDPQKATLPVCKEGATGG